MANNVYTRRSSLLSDAMGFLGLVYFTTVREVRLESGNAMLGMLSAVSRTLMLVFMFWVLFEVIGLRSSIIRGDTVMFLVSGILLFFMHNSTVQKTVQAGTFSSPIMNHAPMTPTLLIISSALSNLYLHIFAIGIIFAGLFVFTGELEIYNWQGIALPFVLAWFSGMIMGLLFLIMKPFAPKLMSIVSLLYQRANLITSGKFFVANMLPTSILPFFAWNPLFHSIDQMRGAIFVNYFPRNSSNEYTLVFCAIGLIVGLMIEFWLRRTVSRSTGASR